MTTAAISSLNSRPWPKIKCNNSEIKAIIDWVRGHCYPNEFELSGYPTYGPDRKKDELIFEDDTEAQELVDMLVALDKDLGHMYKIPF